MANVRRANARKVGLFCFGVGNDGNDSRWIGDLNHALLKNLSLQNHGAYRRIKQQHAGTALAQHFEVLSRPLLRHVKVEYGGARMAETTQTSFDALYAGNDLIICGRIAYDEAGTISTTVSAVTGSKDSDDAKECKVRIEKRFELELDAEAAHEHVERIWAYFKLRQLARSPSKNDAEARALALKHQFVTPWTSMIVVSTTPTLTTLVTAMRRTTLRRMKRSTAGEAEPGEPRPKGRPFPLRPRPFWWSRVGRRPRPVLRHVRCDASAECAVGFLAHAQPKPVMGCSGAADVTRGEPRLG